MKNITNILLFGEGVEGTPEERQEQFRQVLVGEVQKRGWNDLLPLLEPKKPKKSTSA